MWRRSLGRPIASGRNALFAGRKQWTQGHGGIRFNSSEKGGKNQVEEAKPVQTATTFFMLTNPELYLDPKKGSTIKLIAAVWIVFGGYLGYLLYQEREAEREKAKAFIGPRMPPQDT